MGEGETTSWPWDGHQEIFVIVPGLLASWSERDLDRESRPGTGGSHWDDMVFPKR